MVNRRVGLGHESVGEPVAGEDHRLVVRVREGDRDAFDALVRAHVAPLLAFAFRQVGTRAVAEELVQDVLFNIWRNHATWQVPGTVSAYLFRAVQNRVYNALQRDRVAKRWQDAEAAQPLRVVASPEDMVSASESEAVVGRMVAELPAGVRDVVRLRHNEELTHPEIAKRLGISIKTVERRVARARTLLRKLLAKRPS